MELGTTSPPGYTTEQRGLPWMWHREGVSRRTIAARLGKNPGSIHDVVRAAGGIAPRLRVRAGRDHSRDRALARTRALEHLAGGASPRRTDPLLRGPGRYRGAGRRAAAEGLSLGEAPPAAAPRRGEAAPAVVPAPD